MPNLTLSADIDTFLQADSMATARATLGADKMLALTAHVATWNDPSGEASLKISAPDHAATVELNGGGPVRATLIVTTDLPALLNFGGDAQGLILPMVLQAGAVSVIAITRESGQNYVATRLSETLIDFAEAPKGTPVAAFQPSYFADITALSGATTGAGRALNLWKSTVGSGIMQATGLFSVRPNLKANGPRGEWVPNFDGSNNSMAMASAITGTSGAYTVFVAARVTALGGSTTVLWAGASGSPPPYLGITSAGQLTHYNGSTSLTSVALPNLTTNGWVIFAVRQGATSRDIFVNLTKIKTGAGVTQNLSFSSLGALPAGSNYVTADIGEVTVYDGYLSDTVVAQELTRLCKRWRTRSRFVVADGNSLTSGATDGEEPGDVSYPTQLKTYFATKDWVLNYGVSGQTTVQMSSDAAAEIDPFGPRIDGGYNLCLAWEIGNDLAVGGSNTATAETNFQTYCAARQSAGYKVICADLPGRPDAGNLDSTSRAAVNAWLLANYASFSDALARLTQVDQIEDRTNTGFRTTTAVHFYSTGNALIAREFFKKMALIP